MPVHTLRCFGTRAGVSERPSHRTGRAFAHTFRQWPRIRRVCGTRVDRGGWRQDDLHRARKSMGKRPHRVVQCPPARRTAQRLDLLFVAGGSDRHRKLAQALQCGEATWLAWLSTASARGDRAGLCCMARCVVSDRPAAHAAPSRRRRHELTFHPDHSMGSGQVLAGSEHLRACRGASRLPAKGRGDYESAIVALRVSCTQSRL